MINGRPLALALVILSVLRIADSASLPIFHLTRSGPIIELTDEGNEAIQVPVAAMTSKVREGVPPPLCAGRCASPVAGPVCAFDARGTARTFATLCELEAVSCRENTYYAITSLGEC